MSIFVMPQPSAFGQNVRPYDGAKLYFYEAGTTTAKTSYTDPDETVAHTQPVVADGNGRFDAIFISGIYKAVLTDKNDVQIWSEDNLSGFGDAWSIQGDFDSSTNSGDYPSSGQKGYVYRVTEAFTLNATSGAYKVNVGDFIYANKNGATGINADWDIVRGVTQTKNTVALTDGASIATDCSKGTVFTVTIEGNRTLANPTNKLVGQEYTWIITQDSTGSRTLDFGTDFNFDGSDYIKSAASAVTIIKGTVVSSTVIRCKIINDQAVDFESKNLIIDVASNTTVDADAGKLSFLSDSGDFVVLDDIDTTFDITTDLMSGTSEKASHWYQLWLSVTGLSGTITRKMVPDLTGTTDGTTASKLVDSTADFVTDKVSVGDIVYNTTDLTQATVTAIDDLNTLSLSADIFISGEDYKIRLLSPTGLSAYKARIGAAYNNASSNLDDSFYTQIQSEKLYLGDGTDFTITCAAASLVIKRAIACITQVNDWTGKGVWMNQLNIAVTHAAQADGSLTLTGTTFKNVSGYTQSFAEDATNINDYALVRTTAGSGVITVTHNNAAATGVTLTGRVELDKKPTFHN